MTYKSVINRVKHGWMAVLAILVACSAQAGNGNVDDFSLQLPQLAGVLRLGIGNGEKTHWLTDLKVEKRTEGEGQMTLTYRGIFNKSDALVLRYCKLTDTNGFIIEATGIGLPDGTQLYGAFGGCYGQVLPDGSSIGLKPEYCKDNVFSVEGTAFTVYYGEVMKLRVVRGIMPPDSEIRLSDAHRQNTPQELFHSGKKTDSPMISAVCPVRNGEKYYFCCFTQNRKADYNYFMLPALFRKEYKSK